MLDRARVRSVFTEAAEAAGDEVAALLDRECGTDGTLRAEVESLLASAARRPAFLASPTVGEAAAGMLAGLPGERAGTTIGPYRLVEEIGRGGFGSVYVAEQVAPVRRRVAFKIIKPGMDTRAVISRFEAERQALALMDHAHIARVFDAGATESGRPYFVMELVRGDLITAYCDRSSLSVRERLGVFLQVCHAVQHAHSKGVIHRDIKPANVLVATEDGRPHAKVIDFGIAKATQAGGGGGGGGGPTERSALTEFRQFVGTPEYMSPEQAEGSLNTDTRTDVYSLGVLLYELLTGATPFDGRALRSAAYGEVQRIIREVEPPRPSTRLSTLGAALASVASRRGAQPGQLSLCLRGDLDWIVMRCLEKDRSRRYATCDALAADVQAFLRGDPVSAAPPSARYRARKFVAKNRGLVLGAATVLAVLVLGIAGTTWGMLHARRSERAAEHERDGAAAVRDFLTRTFEGVSPQVARGRSTELLGTLMDNAAARIESGELAGNPRAEMELRLVIASVNLELARFDRARQIMAPIAEDDWPPPLTRVRWLVTRAELALSSSEVDEAERLLLSARQLLETSGEGQADLRGRILSSLVSVAAAKNDIPGQLHLANLALQAAEALRPPDPELLAERTLLLGKALRVSGRPADAVESFGRAMSLLDHQQQARNAPGQSPLRVQVLLARASTYGLLGNLDPAEADLVEALRDADRVFPAAHPTLIEVYSARANAYAHSGRFDEAVEAYKKVVASQRALYGADSLQVADSLSAIAYTHSQRRQWRSAIECLTEVQAIREKRLSREQRARFSDWRVMADCLINTGRADEALALARRWYDLALPLLEPDSEDALLARRCLMVCLYFAGDDSGAAAEGLSLLERCDALGHDAPGPWMHLVYAVTGDALVNVGKPESSEQSVRLLRACADLRSGAFGDGDPRVARARLQLGRGLVMHVIRHSPGGRPDLQAEEWPAMLAEAEKLLIPNFDVLIDTIETLDPPYRAKWVSRTGQAIVTLYATWQELDPSAHKSELVGVWTERVQAAVEALGARTGEVR